MQIEKGHFDKNGEVLVIPTVWYVRELLELLHNLKIIDETFADEVDGKIVLEASEDLSLY